MSDKRSPRLGRAIIISALVFATLGFGLAGLCGAAFTVMSLPDLFKSGPENYAGAALVISVPSLIVGAALAWVCGLALSRLVGHRTANKE